MLACPFLDHQAKDSDDSDQNSSDDAQLTDLSYVSQGSSHPNASPSLYLASLGSQAGALGFGSPLANHRQPFESSYDPHVRHLAPEGYRGNICPDGHRCLDHRFKKTRYCDECLAEIPAGSVGQRCSICDYDLCSLCCTRSNPGVASNPVIHPSPALVVPPRPPPSIADATIPNPVIHPSPALVVPPRPPPSIATATIDPYPDVVFPQLQSVVPYCPPLQTFNRMKLKRKAPLITHNISLSLGLSAELDCGVVVVTKPSASPASSVVPDAAAAAVPSATAAASNASAPQPPTPPPDDASYDLILISSASSSPKSHSALSYPAAETALPMICAVSANPLPASSLAAADDTHASALSPAPASTQVSTPMGIQDSVLNAIVPVLAPVPVCSSVLHSLISSLPEGVTLSPAETNARADLFRIFHCAGVVPYKHYEMLAHNLIFTHGVADSEDLQYMIHADSAVLGAFMTAGQLSCLTRFFDWPPSRYSSEYEHAETAALSALTLCFETAGVVPSADYLELAHRLIDRGIASDLSLRDSLLSSLQSFDLPSLMVKPMQAGRIIKFLSNVSE
jgi:hypothetical protein